MKKHSKLSILTIILITLLLSGCKMFETQFESTRNEAVQEIPQLVDETNGISITSTVEQKPLVFINKKQLVLGELDSLGRATNAHIQLRDSDEPTKKREPRLTYNPVGWHNYKFSYKASDGTQKKAWLFNRGHLIGYQFSGLNDESRNLVPETALLNAGNYSGMNSSNTNAMLYYENQLDNWLSNHPNYYLDYQVTPLYQRDELIPRYIRLAYVGIDENAEPLKITLSTKKEVEGSYQATVVYLKNESANATINYLDGTAQQR
ncbi:MAG: DNA/RNA non-specific endonuclease [Streptococcaceae bacterium]|jgi:DNA-entry nuclease|nr:DNA/RNA non-specific endonuclease [Streptococcaceae bacterium]